MPPKQHRLFVQAVDDAHQAILRLRAAEISLTRFRHDTPELAGQRVGADTVAAAAELSNRIGATLQQWYTGADSSPLAGDLGLRSESA